MATTYGSFPGVQVTTAGGGITSVAIGDEENLVLFGEADYARDGQNVQDDGLTADTSDGLDSSVDGSVEEPQQINARSEADLYFGQDTELANAMQAALANGANVEFMWGVAPERYIRQESISSQTGSLSNTPIYEAESEVWVDDDGTALDVNFVYDLSVSTPSVSSQVNINPFTGEFAAGKAPAATNFTVDYRSVDYDSAFGASDVRGIVSEDETGVYVALSEDDDVSASLQAEVADLREDYQLVNALHPAEPNDNERIEDENGDLVRFDARYDASDYDPGATANQSIDADYFFKFAPVRQENVKETVMGGVGGLFAGNPIDDPIYNEALTGYQRLEQSFSKTDANNMRDQNIIPIRQAGSIRVKDNRSTSTATDWERDFWRRRITDRVLLVAKTVGDQIIGRINDDETREAAQRQISAEMRSLVDQRLIRPNTDTETNWFVDVYESSNDPDEVKVDIGFTPYGIIKRIDASVTINT